MEEIKVGEYVRTRKGKIDIFSKIDDEELMAICEKNKYWLSEITKHKEKLIDLIEVGDYVNGARVGDIDIDNDEEEGTGEKYLWCNERAIFEEDIKTVITKEQFKNMEYKVEV